MHAIASGPQVTALRAPRTVPEDPVGFWLSRLDTDSRKGHRSHLDRWLRWLQSQPGERGITARELLQRQLEAEDPYRILDLLQTYVSQLTLRKSSKRKAYTVVKSFFSHNRCALPSDPTFKIRSDKPPVQPKLTVQSILDAYRAANLRYRSVILFKWQSFVDNARLEYVCNNCSDQIVQQIRDGTRPVRIDIPGRKSNENDSEGAFYTFIGKDAVDALTRYFEQERGWPKPGDPIWLKADRSPLTRTAFETAWIRLFRRIGVIPRKKGPAGSRYGYNPHEMRDVATTLLHLKAKADGFDMDCAKFWSGRVGALDREKYDKFYQDVGFVRRQYLIAEKYLNIISGPLEIEELTEKLASSDFIQELVKNPTFINALRDALSSNGSNRLESFR